MNCSKHALVVLVGDWRLVVWNLFLFGTTFVSWLFLELLDLKVDMSKGDDKCVCYVMFCCVVKVHVSNHGLGSGIILVYLAVVIRWLSQRVLYFYSYFHFHFFYIPTWLST